MAEKLYYTVVAVVAFGIAGCAAYFSVIGLAGLFSGSFWTVVVMAGFLEAGKFVCASTAYTLRGSVPTWMRGLLVFFVIIMSGVVTSLGIFSFLSSSYQEGVTDIENQEAKIERLEDRRQLFEDRAASISNRLEVDQADIEDLTEIQSERGWLTESQDQRLQRLGETVPEQRQRLQASQDSLLSYSERIQRAEQQEATDAKLGTVEFLVEAAGLDGNKAVLYLIVVLIFVFDPMALVLVAAISMASGIEDDIVQGSEQSGSEASDQQRQEADDQKLPVLDIDVPMSPVADPRTPAENQRPKKQEEEEPSREEQDTKVEKARARMDELQSELVGSHKNNGPWAEFENETPNHTSIELRPSRDREEDPETEELRDWLGVDSNEGWSLGE